LPDNLLLHLQDLDMIKKSLIISALAVSLLTIGGQAFAEDQQQQPATMGPLMSQQEIQAYQEKMRNAQTPEEREQIQKEHSAQVQERAKARSDAQRKEYEERTKAYDSEMDKSMGSDMSNGQGDGDKGE
jgi:hypothetical protein